MHSDSSHVNVSFLMECPNNEKKVNLPVKLSFGMLLPERVQCRRKKALHHGAVSKLLWKQLLGFILLPICHCCKPFPPPSLCHWTLNLSPKGSAEPNLLLLFWETKNTISPISSAPNASLQPDVSAKRTFQTTCLWVHSWQDKIIKSLVLFCTGSCLEKYILVCTLTTLTFSSRSITHGCKKERNLVSISTEVSFQRVVSEAEVEVQSHCHS